MWQTQIANKTGTTDLWVRSRNAGDSSSAAAWNAPWTRILTGTNYNNYVPSKTGAGASGTWSINVTGTAGKVAWDNVSSKPSYYDAKAIKAITRSNTTFTYTCMDGTTGTFTQQDNNTTYSAGTGITLSGTTFSLTNSSISIAGNSVALGGSISAATLRSALGLSNAMHFIGVATVTVTDGSTVNPEIDGYTVSVPGDVIIDKDSAYEYVWTGKIWERLGGDGSYKIVQSAVSDPAASGNSSTFIKTISQNANGVITATKATIATHTIQVNGTNAVTYNGGGAATVNLKSGSGISVSNSSGTVTFAHSNSVTAKTAYGSTATTASANGGKIVVTDVKYDAQGHITGSADRTITLS